MKTANNVIMVSFWHLSSESELINLRSFAQRHVCCFGCTYTYKCYQSFSVMKLIKLKNCSSLTDFYLNGLTMHESGYHSSSTWHWKIGF